MTARNCDELDVGIGLNSVEAYQGRASNFRQRCEIDGGDRLVQDAALVIDENGHAFDGGVLDTARRKRGRCEQHSEPSRRYALDGFIEARGVEARGIEAYGPSAAD